MELKRIDYDFSDKGKLFAINDDAFPEKERIPSDRLLAVLEEYGCSSWAIYDGGTMVGFTCVLHSEKHRIGYIWFLAIASECRNRGYGSRTLRLLKEKYPACQLILDMEEINPEADNCAQRLRRLRFYERNGFERAFIGMRYLRMDFELMSCPAPLRFDDFKAMITEKAKTFHPVYSRIPTRTVLFLHGFFASGQCVPAMALREALAGEASVMAPDLPLHPQEALAVIRDFCDKAKPDLLVGNSCGSFYAQMVANERGIPALLGNPHFEMTAFLRSRIGMHRYKSTRRDGKQDFTIDEALVSEFATLESVQFDLCREHMKEKVWGLFGTADTLAHFEPTFRQLYPKVYRFPGAHTPTAEEVKKYYAPLAINMLNGR